MWTRTLVNLFVFVLALFCVYRWSSISQVTKEQEEFLGLVASGGYHGANKVDVEQHESLKATARRFGFAGLAALSVSAIGITLQWRRFRRQSDSDA